MEERPGSSNDKTFTPNSSSSGWRPEPPLPEASVELGEHPTLSYLPGAASWVAPPGNACEASTGGLPSIRMCSATTFVQIDLNKSVAASISSGTDRLYAPTSNVGRGSSASTSHTSSSHAPDPSEQGALARGGWAPRQITQARPLAESGALEPRAFSLSAYGKANHRSPTSNEARQRRLPRVLPSPPGKSQNDPATKYRWTPPAGMHSSSSRHFSGGETGDTDADRKNQGDISSSTTEDLDTVMTDGARTLSTHRQQGDLMDEVPHHTPGITISPYTVAAASSAAPAKGSSIAESTTTYTPSLSTHGPGGRFWTLGEYRILATGHANNEDWETIADKLPGRNFEECRKCIEEPNSRGLLGEGSHPHWTAEEERILIDLRDQGKEWSDIATALPARSANGCQTRWRYKFEPRKEKPKKWWELEAEARQRRDEEKSREHERRRRQRCSSQAESIERDPIRSVNDISMNAEVLQSHSREVIRENFPHRSLRSTRKRRDIQESRLQPSGAATVTVRHRPQTSLIPPPPWSRSHPDFWLDSSSYPDIQTRTSELVPYPYPETHPGPHATLSPPPPGPLDDDLHLTFPAI